MATVTVRPRSRTLLSHLAGRSMRLAREVPVIPLLILTLLAFVAVLAPVLAPHSRLDTRRSQDHAERVEDALLGTFDCLCREIIVLCPGNERGKVVREVGMCHGIKRAGVSDISSLLTNRAVVESHFVDEA